MKKYTCPNAGALAARGFTAVAGTTSLFRHPGFPFLFKRTESVEQAIAAGGVMTFSPDLTGGNVGSAVWYVGESAQYAAGIDQLSAMCITHDIKVTPVGPIRGGQFTGGKMRSNCSAYIDRFSARFVEVGGSEFMAIVTTAYRGHGVGGDFPGMSERGEAVPADYWDSSRPRALPHGDGLHIAELLWLSVAGDRQQGSVWVGGKVVLRDHLAATRASVMALVTEAKAREATEQAWDAVLTRWMQDSNRRKALTEPRVVPIRIAVSGNRVVLPRTVSHQYGRPIFETMLPQPPNGSTERYDAVAQSSSTKSFLDPVTYGAEHGGSFLDGTPIPACDAICIGESVSWGAASAVGPTLWNGKSAGPVFGSVFPTYTPSGTASPDLSKVSAAADRWSAMLLTCYQRIAKQANSPAGSEPTVADAEQHERMVRDGARAYVSNAANFGLAVADLLLFDNEVTAELLKIDAGDANPAWIYGRVLHPNVNGRVIEGPGSALLQPVKSGTTDSATWGSGASAYSGDNSAVLHTATRSSVKFAAPGEYDITLCAGRNVLYKPVRVRVKAGDSISAVSSATRIGERSVTATTWEVGGSARAMGGGYSYPGANAQHPSVVAGAAAIGTLATQEGEVGADACVVITAVSISGGRTGYVRKFGGNGVLEAYELSQRNGTKWTSAISPNNSVLSVDAGPFGVVGVSGVEASVNRSGAMLCRATFGNLSVTKPRTFYMGDGDRVVSFAAVVGKTYSMQRSEAGGLTISDGTSSVVLADVAIAKLRSNGADIYWFASAAEKPDTIRVVGHHWAGSRVKYTTVAESAAMHECAFGPGVWSAVELSETQLLLREGFGG